MMRILLVEDDRLIAGRAAILVATDGEDLCSDLRGAGLS